MSGGKECFYDLFDDSDVDDEISSFIKEFVPEKKAPGKDIKPNHKLSTKDVKVEPKTIKEFKPEIKRNLPAKDIKSDPKQKPTAKDVKPDPIQKANAKDVKPDPVKKATAKDVKPGLIQKANAKDVKPDPVKKATAKDVKPDPVKKATAKDVKPDPIQKANAKDVKPDPIQKQPAKPENKDKNAKDIPTPIKEENKMIPKNILNELVTTNYVSNEPTQKSTVEDVKLEPNEKHPAKDVKSETKQISSTDIPSLLKGEKKIVPKMIPNERVSSNNVLNIKGSTSLDNCEKKDIEQKKPIPCEDLQNRANSGKQEQKDIKIKTEIITKVNDDQKQTAMEVSKYEENKLDKSSEENSKFSSKDLLVNDYLESLLNEKCEAVSNDSHLSPICSDDSMSLDNTELEKEIQHFLGKNVETQSTDKGKSSLNKKTGSKSVSEIQRSSSQAKGDEANLQEARQDNEKNKPVETDSGRQKLESFGPDSQKKENEEKYKADEDNGIKKNAESNDSNKKQQNDGKHKAEECDTLKRKTESSDLDYQKKQKDTKRKKEESDCTHKKQEDNKRKAESNVEENDSKKRKRESSTDSVTYNKTIAKKTKHIAEKFRKLNSYVNYCVRRGKRPVDIEIDDIRQCPPDERTSSIYCFFIGSDLYTDELSIGWKVESADSDQPKVMRLGDEKDYLPNKIADFIKVFKMMIQAHERGRVDGVKKIWKDLYIYINRRQELMLNVIVFFSTSIVKEIHSLLVDFFKSGEGKKFQVASVYVTCYYKMDGREELIPELILGKSYFELLQGLNIQFAVCVENWSSIYGLKLLCQGVEELLAPTRNTCIMDIFCGSGLLGFYLSKMAGKILAYDDAEVMRISKKNAVHNNISGIQYFSGNCDDIEYEAKRSKYDELTAIINWNSASNHDLTLIQVAKTMRKITRLNKLVLIINSETLTEIPFRTLCDPEESGRPFVMVTVIPLDSMPFQFEYTLLMLFLRNSEVHGKLGLHRASKPNVKDYWWNWMYEVDDTRTKQKEDELKSRKEEEMKRKLRKQLERKRKEEEEEMKQKMEEKWKRKLQEELVRKKQEELERIRNEEEEQRKKEEEERQRKEKEEKEKRLTFFKKRLRVEQLRRAQGDQKNDGDKEQCKEEDNEARKKKEMEEQKKQAQKVEKKKQSVTEKKTEPLEQLRRQIEEEKVRAKRNAERRKQQYEERKRKAEEEEHWRKQQPRIPVWVEPPTAHVDLMMEERMRIMMEEEQRKRMEFEEYRRRLEEEAYRTVETETVVFDYNHGTSSQKKEDLDKLKSSDNVMNTDSATTGSAGKASNPVSRPVMKWLEKLREVSGDTDASKVPCVQDASPQQKSSDLPSLLSLKVEKPSSLCEPKRNIPASKTPQAQQFIGKSPASLNPWLKTPGYFGSPSWDQTSGQYGGKIDSDASASQNIDQRSSTSGLGNMFVPNIMTNSKDQWTSGSNFYGASTTSNTHLGAVKQTTYGSNLKNTYGETSSGSVDHRLSNSNYSNMYGTGAASASASGLDQRISGSNVSNVFGTTPNFTSSSDYVNVHGIDQRSSGSSFNNYYSVPDSANKGSSSHLNSSKLYGSTGGPTVTADPRGRPGLLGPPPSIPNAYGGRHDSYSNLPNPGYGVRSDNQHQSLSGMNERNIDTYSSHSGRQLDTYNTGGAYNYAGGEFDWSKRNVTSEKDLSQDNNFSFRKTFDEARNVGSSYLGKR